MRSSPACCAWREFKCYKISWRNLLCHNNNNNNNKPRFQRQRCKMSLFEITSEKLYWTVRKDPPLPPIIARPVKTQHTKLIKVNVPYLHNWFTSCLSLIRSSSSGKPIFVPSPLIGWCRLPKSSRMRRSHDNPARSAHMQQHHSVSHSLLRFFIFGPSSLFSVLLILNCLILKDFVCSVYVYICIGECLDLYWGMFRFVLGNV